MKIDRIEVYGYDLSYRYGKYVMSGNQVINKIPSTVVRIITNSGIEGWGEVCPLGPLYLSSHSLGARAALQQILPALNDLDPTNLSKLHATMNASLRGHSYAKSAIDMACWDILGKDSGKDVATLLGGRLQESFALYKAVPLGTSEEMQKYVDHIELVSFSKSDDNTTINFDMKTKDFLKLNLCI